MLTLADAEEGTRRSTRGKTSGKNIWKKKPRRRTWNVVEGGQRLGAQVDRGGPLPQLLHQDLPLVLRQQLREELVRGDREEQRQLLQGLTQSPAGGQRGGSSRFHSCIRE